MHQQRKTPSELASASLEKHLAFALEIVKRPIAATNCENCLREGPDGGDCYQATQGEIGGVHQDGPILCCLCRAENTPDGTRDETAELCDLHEAFAALEAAQAEADEAADRAGQDMRDGDA